MICAGIDVSKSHLDIAIHPGGAKLRVAYNAAGLEKLDAFLERHRVHRVGFEASGNYDWRLMVHLRKSGRERPAARLQPGQIRSFAKSRLQRAKNDQLDAALIAAFTAQLEHLPTLPQERFDALLAELTYLEQIEQQIALVKTFVETAFCDAVKRRHEREVARLATCRAARLLAIEKAIRRNDDLARRLDLLVSIRGIGLRSALSLVIRLPELGQASREEVAALAGLAPYDDDSGKRSGRRHIQGGRERLRKSLFMCAFAATRHNQDLAAFYKRLRQNGKDHLLAVIAVARKLVILANAIVARGTEWKPQA
jgi:transposase